MSNAATTPAGRRAVSTPDDRASALRFLRSLASELAGGTVHLPYFPDVAIRIRAVLADRSAGMTETLEIVGAEPRLAARLLQAANSAALCHSGKPLTDLRAAITRLGYRAVQSSAMAYAVQQLRLAPALRSISKPLHRLWEESVTVASICQIIARRTHVSPDEAFLTGLLHAIGRLYIMARVVGRSAKLYGERPFMEMVDSWHPAIGKAVLENWGFAETMSDAVGTQGDYDHGGRSAADLPDVLIAGIVLAHALREPEPRTLDLVGINAFDRLGLTAEDCAAILKHAEYQLDSLHEVFGC